MVMFDTSNEHLILIQWRISLLVLFSLGTFGTLTIENNQAGWPMGWGPCSWINQVASPVSRECRWKHQWITFGWSIPWNICIHNTHNTSYSVFTIRRDNVTTIRWYSTMTMIIQNETWTYMTHSLSFNITNLADFGLPRRSPKLQGDQQFGAQWFAADFSSLSCDAWCFWLPEVQPYAIKRPFEPEIEFGILSVATELKWIEMATSTCTITDSPFSKKHFLSSPLKSAQSFVFFALSSVV